MTRQVYVKFPVCATISSYDVWSVDWLDYGWVGRDAYCQHRVHPAIGGPHGTGTHGRP